MKKYRFVALIAIAMKLTFIQMILAVTFGCAVYAHNLGAQNLDTPISLRSHGENLSQVLNRIETLTDVKFVYSPDVVPVEERVHLKIKNSTLGAVLEELLEPHSIDFKVSSGRIILYEKLPKELAHAPLTLPVLEMPDRVVTGTITGPDGMGIPGANILIKGTVIGTVSDADGAFTLNVPSAHEQGILSISFLGYKTQEVTLGSVSNFSIVLEEDVTSLEEIVVVGYGTQKKKEVTGAIATVDGAELIEKPMSDARLALQGVAPGLTIVDRGGVPGSEDLSMRIRGIASLGAGSDPLVLIDGVQASLSQVNPNDIEDISVLKDAASSAIYGARASNGVILITTKRGADNKLSLGYHGYAGYQKAATLPELVSAKDYLTLVNEALVNAGGQPKYSDDYIANTVNGTDPIQYPYVNLFEELFDKGFVQNHSLSMTGGNETIKTMLSLNYLDQEGLLPNTNTKKIGLRLNNDYRISPKVAIRSNVYFSNRVSESPNRMWEAISAMVGTSPATVMRYPNGAYGLNKDNNSALAGLEVGGMNTNTREEMSINLGLDYEIISNLMLKADYSYIRKNFRNKSFKAAFDFIDPADASNIVYAWNPNKLDEGRWEEGQWNFTTSLGYGVDKNEHHIKVLAGFDVLENTAYSLNASRQNIYNQTTPELNLGDVQSKDNAGYTQDWALMSFFGRANYNYKGRYMLEANFRYDGSSRFAEGNKWGVFPSFSAGWVASDENFMSEIGFLDDLKFRASWGQLGNQNIGLYSFSSTIYPSYSYSFNNNQVDGYSQRNYANQDISWETSEMTNFGVDLAFFKGKLSANFDYFIKDTKDMLMVLPISYLVGLDPSEINRGSMRNKGWEAALNYRSSIGQFNYSVGLNMADVQNELTDFGGKEPAIQGWNINKVGEAVNSFYGYKSAGLFQTEEEILKHATQPNHAQLKPGDIKLTDINEDGVVDDADRTVIGSALPRYTYGINLSASFKNFDFSAFFQGVLKAENYFYGAPNEGPAFEIFTTTRVLDRWTPENKGASFPRLEAASNKNNYLYSDFWIRDASYLRLKNIQLGYTLPETMMAKAGIQSLRLYLGATNVFTITDVESGLDPETYDGRPSYYPPVATYSFGIQANF